MFETRGIKLKEKEKKYIYIKIYCSFRQSIYTYVDREILVLFI